MMNQFNNREMATGIWCSLLFAWGMSQPSMRRVMGGLLRTILSPKLLVWWSLMALYVAGMITLLARVHLWNTSLVKDSILWFLLVAIAMSGRYVTSRNTDSIFRAVVKDSLTAVIILEFLTNTYTFSLPIELLFIPACVLVGGVDAILKSDKQYSSAAKLTTGLLVAIGLFMLAYAISHAIADYRSLGTWSSMRSLILCPLLSILLSPFIYVMVLACKYEELFCLVDFGNKRDRLLRRYAKVRILRHAGLSLGKLRDLQRRSGSGLFDVTTKEDLDRTLG